MAGDASAAELEIDEVNTGIYAFDGGALLDALEQVGADNAQGERYLPEVLEVLRARRRDGRDARRLRPGGRRSASTTAPSSRSCARRRSGGSTSATCSPA